MDKEKQRSLALWLKEQSKLGTTWLLTAIGLAFMSSLLLIVQAALLANILHGLIIEQTNKYDLWLSFFSLAIIVCLRALCRWGKELAGYRAGEMVRLHIRHLILDKLQLLGPATIQGKPSGTWASLVLEQIEEMQDFFALYLPQMAISVLIPSVILIAIFPINWVAGLIFLITAPLIPFFMALVGMGAADANRRNFKALQHLSGYFYDRLRGLTTIRLFDQVEAERKNLIIASEGFRQRTMEVLRLAFISSAVLEFFTALSIAVTAVYFGFSFIGKLNFGHYGLENTLFVGLFILVLAPEFYQPLRDLGTYYHVRAQAIGAAESIVHFLESKPAYQTSGNKKIPSKTIELKASKLEVLSPDGVVLAGPLSFTIHAGQKVALVGESGAGKTSLINAILGFLPYRGSLTINNVELRKADLSHWHKQISWVGQNPQLFYGTIKDNICLRSSRVTEDRMHYVTKASYVNEFISRLEHGSLHHVGDKSSRLSVGQAQRIAVARALLQDGYFWLLDEPTTSLDATSERLIMASLEHATQDTTTLLISHRIDLLGTCDLLLIMEKGKLVQQGKFEALRQKGLFAEMIKTVDKRNFDA
ncbi:heme ABC transporter permease/ATP-binding protein CydD [Candidatus Enterovibrio escicola]|uniref:Transport ATP-binding protein CydD n=1 Tax=Candidatus Enterovibrio escicola TaxID=1927127 RepID=A0A2A5T079_9GAMM|nr:cysteine/glutathione ABC transporter permease/ATP-binding protein CydD [Candidatus Enterovibrio escacola]PCS21565.1 Transport ATP-binding protein CydD [Candidatus Enterovibrio escacola]